MGSALHEEPLLTPEITPFPILNPNTQTLNVELKSQVIRIEEILATESIFAVISQLPTIGSSRKL